MPALNKFAIGEAIKTSLGVVTITEDFGKDCAWQYKGTVENPQASEGDTPCKWAYLRNRGSEVIGYIEELDPEEQPVDGRLEAA